MTKTDLKGKSKAGHRREPVEMVRVHNRFAGRPLMFQVPGRAVRLGPGESETLPKSCLNTHELKSLCTSRLVEVKVLKEKGTERTKSPTKVSPAALEEGKPKAGKAKERKASAQGPKLKPSLDKATETAAATDSSGAKGERT